MSQIVSQAVDELGNTYKLFSDGTLEKRTALNVLLWTVATAQEPTLGNFVYANSISLDINDDVWLTYDDQLDTQVRSTTTGLVTATIVGATGSAIVPLTGGTEMYILSPLNGVLYDIGTTLKNIIRSFDLTTLVVGYVTGLFQAQIASSVSGKIYFGALINVNNLQTIQLIQLNPLGNGTFTGFQVAGAGTFPIVAVSADVLGNIYAALVDGTIVRYSEGSLLFDFTYNPPAAGGVVDIVTFDASNNPVLIDDGTFGFLGSKTRTVNPATGVVTSSAQVSTVGTQTGDPLGYRHAHLTRSLVPPPVIIPSFVAPLIYVFVEANGRISATGLPGATANADTMTLKLNTGPVTVGTATVNSDGSLSLVSAPGIANPAGEAVTLTFTKGLQTAPYVTASVVRGLPAGITINYQSVLLLLVGAGNRLKAQILDTFGVPVPPSPGVLPIFRLRHDLDGKFFNGSIFVADDGDYLKPSYDTLGGSWYFDLTLPVGVLGAASFSVKGNITSSPMQLVSNIADKATLDLVNAGVTQLLERADVVFSAPVAPLTDPTQIGGFIAEKLIDIQKTVRKLNQSIVGAQNVVVESIAVDVSAQSVPKGSTPAIDIVVYDQARQFPKDISGATVLFRAKVNLASGLLAINRTAQIIDGPTGQARVLLTAADTQPPQRLQGQIVVMLPGSGIIVSPPFIFDITESVL